MRRFGEFTLDSEARTLARAGDLVPLSGKAFRLLEILVDHHPKVLTKVQLLALVWPDTFVTEASLHSLISELRTALGDSRGSPRFLRTVHGYGYGFCGPVVDDDAAPRPAAVCSILWAGLELPLSAGENVLGRDPDVSIRVVATTVSRRHARIVVGEDEVVIEDLESKNGTAVAGCPLQGPRVLHDGDEIRLGSVHLTFRLGTEAASTYAMVST
jgi:DNA-binding winged helix-turn-helix (wHTH) protein